MNDWVKKLSISCIAILIAQKSEKFFTDMGSSWCSNSCSSKTTDFVSPFKFHFKTFCMCWNVPLEDNVFSSCRRILVNQKSFKLLLLLRCLVVQLLILSSVPALIFHQGFNRHLFSWSGIVVSICWNLRSISELTVLYFSITSILNNFFSVPSIVNLIGQSTKKSR